MVSNKPISGFVKSCIVPIVKKTAIGSLLADSNSSKGFNNPLRLILLDLITEKTAAASVDEIIPPTKKPQRKETLNMYETKIPINRAVRKTPMVERVVPDLTIGLTSLQLVSSPPANRIKISAIIPIFLASAISSNNIPPTPSEPANIPTAINRSSAGIPAFSENFVIVTLIRINTAAVKRIISSDIICNHVNYII